MNSKRNLTLRFKQIPNTIAKYTLLSIVSFIAILPILIIVFGSFKTGHEYRSTSALTPPENWLNFDNYLRAFDEGKMLLGFTNTAIILIASLLITILIGAMTAYVLSRFNFRGRKLIMVLFLVAALVPSITTQIPTFQVIKFFNLFNTRTALILLFSGTDIISVYLFLQFINKISPELDESAMLDGANYFQIFFKVILPLLKPAIVTVVVIKGVAIYNDFYKPFLYTPNPKLFMVSTALFKFKGPYGTEWEVICAAIIIAIIPTLIVFLLLQKYIYTGISQGSVK